MKVQIFLIALLLSAFPTFLLAQKAEPLRIQFARGSRSKLVTGTLRGRQQTEYVLGAKAGQTLSLQLTAAPPGSVTVTMLDPKSSPIPVKLVNRHGTVSVQNDGDYEIDLVRLQNPAPKSTFRLTVTIR